MFRPTLSLFLGGLMLAVAATPALAERSVALVLDASGSMNGKLPDRTAKIDAAKAAVAQFAAGIGDDVRLSFRAYGHQHHRSKHDCKDTQLIVPFGAAKDQRGAVVDSANGLTAQGYTPISFVLGLAADDLKGEASDERVIVLVSDGKETCEGDPCLLARKLAEADANLTIHAIGFDVDYQAKTQLQCIAKVGRGGYLAAKSADELATSLTEVAEAEIEDEEIVIVQPKAETGKLKIIGPYFNEVVDAETGEMVTKITDHNNDVDLPPGIYNIRFGKSLWMKSIEIVGGETTEINPGRLKVVGPYFNDVLDPETGTLVEKATDNHNDFPLLAGRYDVMFGKAPWRGVEIREGETTVLNPGRLQVVGPYFNDVVDPETGNVVEKATSSHADFPLPPGTYDLMFG
ncbi:MAG: VWA domain-containing protein, partial [Hyphomicrobiales bacterium]|nr:VWA domain-containing protein [Hyphomicrobiales bacterium]